MPATGPLPRFAKLGLAQLSSVAEPGGRFVNRICTLAGLDPFMDWPVLAAPCLGCVATARDGDAGFVWAVTADRVYVSSGQPGEKSWPIGHVAAYRWPKGIPISTHTLPAHVGVAALKDFRAPAQAARDAALACDPELDEQHADFEAAQAKARADFEAAKMAALPVATGGDPATETPPDFTQLVNTGKVN